MYKNDNISFMLLENDLFKLREREKHKKS